MPIKIPFPELLFPYSPVAKPMPVPPVQDVCEGDMTCVQFSCSLVPYILGLLEVYRYKDSFKGTDEEKTIAVGVMRQLMEVIAMSGCGCDDDTRVIRHRIDPETGEPQISTDDGETWQDDPQSPYIQATEIKPLSGDDGDEKRCEAANNVVESLKDIQARWSSYVGVLNSVTDLIVTMVVDVAVLLFTGLVGAELIAVLTPITYKLVEAAQIMLGTTQEAYNLLFTEENWTLARCILFCNCPENGKYTQADFDKIKQQMVQQLTVPSPDAGDSIKCMIDTLGLIGLNNAARVGGGSSGNCDDCNCGDCSNLENWEVIYGTILEQSAGYLRMASGDAGSGNVAVRLANYSGGDNCCAVTYNILSGVVQNQAYYPCGSVDPIFSVPPAETCMYDVNLTNIFGAAFEVEFNFIDCP